MFAWCRQLLQFALAFRPAISANWKASCQAKMYSANACTYQKVEQKLCLAFHQLHLTWTESSSIILFTGILWLEAREERRKSLENRADLQLQGEKILNESEKTMNVINHFLFEVWKGETSTSQSFSQLKERGSLMKRRNMCRAWMKREKELRKSMFFCNDTIKAERTPLKWKNRTFFILFDLKWKKKLFYNERIRTNYFSFN